jgi:hypothetical protein
MTTERIAQTFPDINSQGLNTSGTAAGIRSFPDPFVAIASGGGVLVQRGSISVGGGSLTASLVMTTPVDVTRSWILFTGLFVNSSTTSLATWRVHLTFTSIAAGFSDEVLVTRTATGPSLDVSFTVVSYTGTGGSSIDVKVADVSPDASPPFCRTNVGGDFVGPYDFTSSQKVPNTSGVFGNTTAAARVVDPATGLDLDLGFVPGGVPNAIPIFRGLEFTEVVGATLPGRLCTPASSRFHPEQWQGELSISRSSAGTPPPNSASGFATILRYRNYDDGSCQRGFVGPVPFGVACGAQCLGVYASLIWFPPPG